MKGLRHWIASQLWRRLAFNHFVVILCTLLVLQLAAAILVGMVARGTAPVEGDAGWLALQFAHAIGWVLDAGGEAEVPLVVEMLQQKVVMPGEVEPLVDVQGFYLKTGNEPIERLLAVTVLDAAGGVVMASGTTSAQVEHTAAWDELVGLALSGETNPYELGRWVTMTDGGLLLGTAAITRSTGEIVGVVAVEIYPSIRLETSGGAAPLVGFLSILLVTALVGLPALVVALLVAGISGVLVSQSLGRRLNPLEQTAQRMAGGDLALRIEDTSSDEIGQVGQAFNQMAGQLAHSMQALEGEKEQVETLLKARRDLVSNVSHDLRTPIASLSAHLETLSEHPERLDEYLPILVDETARVSGLIADLSELSRLDARELKLDLAPVELAGVVDKVIASYRTMAWEQRRIVLEAHLPASLPPVRADVQRMEQVLVNLITNGLRFTPEGGIVAVEAEVLAQEVEVRVSDTGIGIHPKDLPHVFERSYRGDRSRSRPEPGDQLGSGSGLGLAIVKGFVEAMQGSVSATSVPGEGTCIGFRLQRVDRETLAD